MAWCKECAENFEPESLEEGRCPQCGGPTEERRRVPWHFKLLLLATVIYLGWRFVQGIEWVVHHI